tara:strand:- start:189 stop:479 length:291 start_codon:yes stop_codon:yes gene_type:complete
VSIGGKKDEYDFCREEDDLEWWAEQRMNIREVRMLYSSISHYQYNWEKYNGGRPPEEINFLNWYKRKLFSIIADYNFTHHEVEEISDDTTPSGGDT